MTKGWVHSMAVTGSLALLIGLFAGCLGVPPPVGVREGLPQPPRRGVDGFWVNPYEHIVVELEEPFRVSQVRGRLTSAGGGWPDHIQPRFEIALPTSDIVLEAVVDEDGNFWMARIAPGTYRFRAGAHRLAVGSGFRRSGMSADPDAVIVIELPLGV